MTPARARVLVTASGAVAAAFVVLGLTLAGGPVEARREQRDATRLEHLREIAGAFACHAEAGTPGAPESIAALSPACLSPARAALLRDPLSGADYRIEHADGMVRVCGSFELAGQADRYPTVPPFDPATGCVTATLNAPG